MTIIGKTSPCPDKRITEIREKIVQVLISTSKTKATRTTHHANELYCIDAQAYEVSMTRFGAEA